MRRVLAGADDQPRRERPAGDDERGVSHSDPPLLLTTSNEVHNLDLIAVVDDHLGKAWRDDGEIVLDGHPPRVDLELVEQGDDGEGRSISNGSPLRVICTIVSSPFAFLVSGFNGTLSNVPALVESKDSAIS